MVTAMSPLGPAPGRDEVGSGFPIAFFLGIKMTPPTNSQKLFRWMNIAMLSFKKCVKICKLGFSMCNTYNHSKASIKFVSMSDISQSNLQSLGRKVTRPESNAWNTETIFVST